MSNSSAFDAFIDYTFMSGKMPIKTKAKTRKILKYYNKRSNKRLKWEIYSTSKNTQCKYTTG